MAGIPTISAELEGLWQGLLIAQDRNLFPLLIEGDSQILIQMATRILQGSPSSKICNSWRMVQQLLHIERWISFNRAISFTHIRRDGNKVVDLLANLGVDSGRHLLVGSPTNLLSESQLPDFNNLVQEERPKPEDALPDPGDVLAINAIHAN